jgi:hypothetical protein
LVAEDVKDGYVSLAQAREAYGVVLYPEEIKVDLKQTESLRAKRREDREK